MTDSREQIRTMLLWTKAHMKVESGNGGRVALRVGLLIALGALPAICSAGNLFCMPAKGS